MNTLVATLPAQRLDRDRNLPNPLKLLRGLAAARTALSLARRQTAAATFAAPAQDTESAAPNLQEIWGHTVKRARQGSPLHRQTLALLDRDDRLAIEAACGSWRG